MLHTLFKVLATMGVASGPIMLGMGLGQITQPIPQLTNANGGTGLNKFEWTVSSRRRFKHGGDGGDGGRWGRWGR